MHEFLCVQFFFIFKFFNRKKSKHDFKHHKQYLKWSKNIHIKYGPHYEKYPKVNFYFYPDTRNPIKYISSVRPHILKKHFAK